MSVTCTCPEVVAELCTPEMVGHMQVIWMNNARDPEDDHWLQHTLLPSEPNLYKMNIISGELLFAACRYAFDANLDYPRGHCSVCNSTSCSTCT